MCWGVFRALPPTCLSVCFQEIERLKSEKPTWERRLRWEGMKSVFGGPPSLLWMNPFVGFRFRRLQLRPRKGSPEFSVWGPSHHARTGEPTLFTWGLKGYRQLICDQGQMEPTQTSCLQQAGFYRFSHRLQILQTSTWMLLSSVLTCTTNARDVAARRSQMPFSSCAVRIFVKSTFIF